MSASLAPLHLPNGPLACWLLSLEPDSPTALFWLRCPHCGMGEDGDPDDYLFIERDEPYLEFPEIAETHAYHCLHCNEGGEMGDIADHLKKSFSGPPTAEA